MSEPKHYIPEIPEMTMGDAEFIALARTALPQLAKALRAVINTCEEVENLVHKNHTYRTEYDYGMRAQSRAVMEAITDAMEGQ